MGSLGKDGEVARRKLNALLAEYQLSWNDLPAILSESDDTRRDGGDAEPPDAASPATDRAERDVLGVLLAVIEEYIAATPEERIAEPPFQGHDPVADGARRQAELVRRELEAREARGGLEYPQGGERRQAQGHERVHKPDR